MTEMGLLAGSTLIGPIVAVWTFLDASLVAFTLTDKVEDNLHLLSESQRLYLNDLSLGLVDLC